MKGILPPEEQFEVAKDNYKPNSRYKGITSYPIMMFPAEDTLEDKIDRVIKWCYSINENELAEKLREYKEVYEGVQRELNRNIEVYENDDYHYGEAAHKINVLCHAQNKSAKGIINDSLLDSDYERKLFE